MGLDFRLQYPSPTLFGLFAAVSGWLGLVCETKAATATYVKKEKMGIGGFMGLQWGRRAKEKVQKLA